MLQHNISTVSVFQTDQYKNFSMITGNRPLNQNKIARIIKQIEKGNDMLQYYPIQVKYVNDKLMILDGQHRFFICKKLKRPVYYILVTEEKSMQDIALVNSNVEKWKGADFINCYITAGNEDYKTIQKFVNEYGFSLGITLSLLENGTPGVPGGSHATGTLEAFQNGTFKVKTPGEAKTFADYCKQYEAFANWRSRDFLIALYRIQKANKISMKDLYDAYSKDPQRLTAQRHFKNYIVKLEEIMNVGKHKRIIIT